MEKTDSGNEEKIEGDEFDEAEETLLNAYIDSKLSTSPTIDKHGTWLLVGIGATATIIISNLEGIYRVVDANNFKYCLISLIFSGVCGLAQKIIALESHICGSQHATLRSHLEKIAQNPGIREKVLASKHICKPGGKPQSEYVKKVLERYTDLHPRFIRWLLRKEDSLRASRKKRILQYYWQLFFVSFEFAFFLVAIGFIALAI